MAISINDTNTTNIAGAAGNRQVTPINRDQNQASDPKINQQNDTVNLTDSARLLQKLEQNLKDTPVVDSERVAKIKEDINSGNYAISAERVATRFSNFESLLSVS